MVGKVAKIARKLGLKPDCILSSPYTRARETAELCRGLLGKAEVTIEDALEPGHTPYDLYEAIARKFKSGENLLLVFHQPMIGQVLSDLIGSVGNISLRPGSIAAIDIPQGLAHSSGTLVWLLSGDNL